MKELNKLRKKIDKIDKDMLKKLAKRNNISIKIGQIKAKVNGPILDTNREKEQFERFELLAAEYGLDYSFVKKLFEMVINHSKELQK